MMLILMILGVLLTLLGLLGTFSAIRGRLVSDHPHCRACRFDLHGLELNKDSRCPECGHITPPDTRYVRPELRKRRPLLLLVSLLVLFLGATGIAWPKLSQIPSIRNIDWYENSPEWLLLRLESAGNSKALQELHDRLIPGELSDEGLQTLVDRAFAHQSDTSTPWDEQWGDVLLYAFLSERMSDKDTIRYLENAVVFHIDVHQEIGLNDTDLAYWVRETNAERGMSSNSFQRQWRQSIGTTSTPFRLDTPYQLASVIRSPTIVGIEQRGRGGQMSSNRYDPNREGWWIPYTAGTSSTGSAIRIDPEKTGIEFEIEFSYEYTIYKDSEQVLHRAMSERKTIRRVDDPSYAQRLSDPEVLAREAEGLTISSMQIPTMLEASREHDTIRNSSQSLLFLESRLGSDHQLLGDLYLRSGEQEILFKSVAIELRAAVHYGIQAPSDSHANQSWLDYFVEHEAFFDRVIANGQLDVIYRPVPSRAKQNPRIRSVIDHPIVFRDVPIDPLVPEQVTYSTGEKRWALERKNKPKVGVSYTAEEYAALRRPQGVAGELLSE
jgi:hypothetical protein